MAIPHPSDHDGEFVADCRVRDAAELLSHRWDATVAMALRRGPQRRRDLRELIGGLSDKSLTESLGRLAAADLIRRFRYPQAPPRVDYALTERGASFVDGPLAALGRWALEDAAERTIRPAGEEHPTVRPST